MRADLRAGEFGSLPRLFPNINCRGAHIKQSNLLRPDVDAGAFSMFCESAIWSMLILRLATRTNNSAANRTCSEMAGEQTC